MTKQPTKRVKHIPQRTCVGCRQVMPKRNLIRVVRSPKGVSIDLTGKTAGRGAYLHDKKSCWESALKGALNHALKIELTEQDRDVLIHFMESLPVDAMNEA
ncbi:MAG: YlxR family protein [Bellilinea sp.]